MLKLINMLKQNIIQRLKKSCLRGRSGSNFPTGLKWEMVKKAREKEKYIICNASEGEPNLKKDWHILKNHPEEVINGIKIAIKTIKAKEAYIYINKEYYKEFSKTLEKLCDGSPIKIFKKEPGYLRGEETVLLNVIEGKPAIPRIKPPFPTQVGLFGKPTLINNVETFYYVSKISKGEYEKTKFYSILGDIGNKGIFELPENISIKNILAITNNTPVFDFFVQVGGEASGEILLKKELIKPIKNQGSIVVFNKNTTKAIELMRKWAKFFNKENCDKCVPCREGLYRVEEILKHKALSEEDKNNLNELLTNMAQTSLCPLGRMASVPFQSAIKKLL